MPITEKPVGQGLTQSRTGGEPATGGEARWPSTERLQAALRRSAQRQLEAVSISPFTLFFHPTDAFPPFSYAIPDEPCAGDLTHPLTALRSEFAKRGRRARFEFIEEYAPELGPELVATGFAEETRQPLMVCTSATYRPAPPVPELTIGVLTRESGIGEIQEFLSIQRWGFAPQRTKPATQGEAVEFRAMMGGGRGLVARMRGQPAAAGFLSEPVDAVAELQGLATLLALRRRGIGTAITGKAVECALGLGAEAVVLSAEDERAGRVYQRVGFARQATMLTFASS